MYILIKVNIYIYISYTYTWTYPFTCTYIHICTFSNIDTNTHIYIPYIFTKAHSAHEVHTYKCIYTMHILTHQNMHAYIYTYIHICLYIYVMSLGLHPHILVDLQEANLSWETIKMHCSMSMPSPLLKGHVETCPF